MSQANGVNHVSPSAFLVLIGPANEQYPQGETRSIYL